MTAIALWVVGYFAVALPVASLLGRWLRAGREREDLDFQRLITTRERIA